MEYAVRLWSVSEDLLGIKFEVWYFDRCPNLIDNFVVFGWWAELRFMSDGNLEEIEDYMRKGEVVTKVAKKKEASK